VTMSDDEAGDRLREFYAAFGTPGEGPPRGVNVSELMGPTIPRDDFALLREALQDQLLRTEFDKCRRLVEDLASRLTTNELLRELSALPDVSQHTIDQLADGIFWFGLAASLDQRQAGIPRTPFDDQLRLPSPCSQGTDEHRGLARASPLRRPGLHA